MKKSLHQTKVEASEKAVVDSLPGLLGLTEKEFRERMSRPYRWPVNRLGQRLPQGECSFCKQIDNQHPEGRACDYSCVGI